MNKRKYIIDGVELHLSNEQIQELIKQSEKKEKSYFEPEMGQYYYYVYKNKILDSVFDNHMFDKCQISQGNCFATKKEAEDYAKYLHAMGRIRIAVWEANKGWKPDWHNSNEYKYIFYYQNEVKKWDIDAEQTFYVLECTIACRTYDIAENILKSHKSDFDIIANYLYSPKENE